MEICTHKMFSFSYSACWRVNSWVAGSGCFQDWRRVWRLHHEGLAWASVALSLVPPSDAEVQHRRLQQLALTLRTGEGFLNTERKSLARGWPLPFRWVGCGAACTWSRGVAFLGISQESIHSPSPHPTNFPCTWTTWAQSVPRSSKCWTPCREPNVAHVCPIYSLLTLKFMV